MKKLTILASFLFMTALLQGQVIEQYYHFNQPVVTEREGYQQITLEGCLPSGQEGEPSLPWQKVSLILPQGQEAIGMQVEFFDYMELEGSYKILPCQKPRPLSSEEDIPFALNEDVYRSSTPYPTRNYGTVSTQYLNGVAFAFGGFTPVRYIPSTGKVLVANTVKVIIETTASRIDHSSKVWLSPENEASIKRLAQNADMLGTYNKRGRTLSGYDMLVITADAWIPNFGPYLDLYNDKGIRTHIVALEEIYATMEGRDQQEQIRNYIIQEYENNGIFMVSLGGDVSIVPFRPLWCFAQEGEEDQLPADMYYVCLDGTLNDDNDDRWGEVGEDDLLPELGIGRLPFNNEEQFETIMQKTLSYLQNPVLGEFTSPILGAEHLGDGYYGSTDIERLVGTNSDFGYTTHGYSQDYTFKRYYETSAKPWRGAEFRQLIGTGGQYVHHLGHANTTLVAGWDANYMTNNYFSGNDGINHNFMLFHSQGCICGDFSHSCILEKMVTIPTGFVVTSGNSRYGWYQPWGDGMAAHIHREFVDAYCHEHIPSVGMALREAKIQAAPWVTIYGENGCLRWNIYCLNILGDAALYPWFEEPITPDVTYAHGIQQGVMETGVRVATNNQPLEGFRVSIFSGDDLLAYGITEEDGWVSLEFDDPSQLVGDLDLVVTGQSAWPQRLPMKGLTDEPFLYVNDYGFFYQNNTTNVLVFGETYDLETDITNPSQIGLTDVDVTISCDDEQVEILQNHYIVPNVPAGTSIVAGPMFTFKVNDYVIDQTRVLVDVTCSAQGQSWTSSIPLYLNAPVIQFTTVEIDDSMGDGNGYADPGESCTLVIGVQNAGHALANDCHLTISCDSPELNISTDNFVIGDLDQDGTTQIGIDFSTDANIPDGTLFHLDISLQSGEYSANYEYLLTVGIPMESFESGGFDHLGWYHSGDQPWFVTDDQAHSGSYSARSGAIGDNEISNLIIYADVLVDGEISFYFKTSTEYKKDYLKFYIDNKIKHFWSGENDWTQVSYAFAAGNHVFEWRYYKNNKNASGEDCVWIDDITFPRACVITGIEETVGTESVIFPNPCNGTFHIEIEDESDLVVINSLGQKIIDQKVSGSREINLDNVPKGLYLVQISNAKGTETHKLVIQ